MGQANTTARTVRRNVAVNAVNTRQYTIGELSRDFDISLRTLRFYEGRDLLRPDRIGHTRYYSATDRVRLEIILKGKKLGFTLAEIHEMLAAAPLNLESGMQLTMNTDQVEAQIDRLERQHREIELAISELRATRLRQPTHGVAA